MKNYRQIIFYICVGVSVLVIGYFGLFSNSNDKNTNQSNQKSVNQNQIINQENEIKQNGDAYSQVVTRLPEQGRQVNGQKDESETVKVEVQQTQNNSTKEKATDKIGKPFEGLKILKSEISSTAKFYPYQADNIYMEVLAVKASDGSIRTALNTCQVCFDSGRGYYMQVGEYLICQNCKNRFHIDQVELVKGGCNPVPVLEESKKDLGDAIAVSKEFLVSQKEYFSEWKRQ